MNKQYKKIKYLLNSKENRIWLIQNVLMSFVKFFTGFVTLWTLLNAFNLNFTQIVENILPGSSITIMLLAAFACLLMALYVSLNELRKYRNIRVETERAGCSVEISVADSYLTNAFVDYPKSAMCIGISKNFCFQEAVPGSLIADMWDVLAEKGIDKKKVQDMIDHELEMLWTKPDGTIDEDKKKEYIDKNRPKVKVRWEANEKDKYVIRDNYKIGTMVGVTLTWKEKNDKGETVQKSKKLYFIANSEMVSGENMDEPMKVVYDKKASVVEHFPKIWEFFEKDEELTETPPKHRLSDPLLLPLIGAGVANEGYSDVEIFSKIVDLYYENLRKSIREGKQPAIPNLIINIRDTTAIDASKKDTANGRTIDIKNAFWYLQYRNRVNPVVSRDAYALPEEEK